MSHNSRDATSFDPSGNQLRTTTGLRPYPTPNRVEQTLDIGIDGTRTLTQANGTVQTSLEVGDPRFGMQSPLTNSTIETPLGLVASVDVGRRA